MINDRRTMRWFIVLATQNPTFSLIFSSLFLLFLYLGQKRWAITPILCGPRDRLNRSAPLCVIPPLTRVGSAAAGGQLPLYTRASHALAGTL